MKTYLAILLTTILVGFSCSKRPDTHLNIGINASDIRVEYALSKMLDVCNSVNYTAKLSNKIEKSNEINLIVDSTFNLGVEDYEIKTRKHGFDILASSSKGLLHGVMDVRSELLNMGSLKTISNKVVRAKVPFRAIKFNLPWYSYRKGENLQLHDETCRDTVYWESFLDMMAENHFNTLTLWNLNPYVFFVKPASFPDASPFSDQEMTEWRVFWKQLFKMAKARGIETYIVNWNIFVSEEFSKNYGVANYSGKWDYIGAGDTSKLVEKYMRELVTQTINEYDDLAGIGLTLGERMGDMTAVQRKDWINRTIIRGMQEAKRPAKLIYRAPLSAGTSSGGSTSKSTEQLTRNALENMAIEAPIWLEFKYNWSHGHSSPKLSIVHGGKPTDTYWNPPPKNYNVVWTVRNEDFFVLRWCRPEFVRAFSEENLKSYVGGCIIGSECYIPAKDYISKPEFKFWDYAWERQWLFYKTWGNLLYNADQNDDFLIKAINRYYTSTLGQEILTAFSKGSYTAHAISSFFRGTWDGTLYTEGFTSWRDGGGARFITVNQLIHRETLDSAMVNIADFVARDRLLKSGEISPLDVADLLEKNADEALSLVAKVLESNPSGLLSVELNDVEVWAWLGIYFADKIRGGVALETYRKTGDEAYKSDAIIYLEKAYFSWGNVVSKIERYNKQTIPYMFDEHFSWRKLTVEAERDIAIARAEIFNPLGEE